MHAPLLRIQYAPTSRHSPECTRIPLVACADLCMLPVSIHQIQATIDPHVRSCGHWWGCPSGCAEGPGETQQRHRQLFVSPESWDARWLPDWFSGPLPTLHHHLCLSGLERCAVVGLIFWTLAKLNPLQTCTCYSRAWGLIYEWESSRVQFLTAGADNGGDWMKQFVTSSLPLTFTGCWPFDLRGALLGIDVRGRSLQNGFFCHWFRMYAHNKMNGNWRKEKKIQILPVPVSAGGDPSRIRIPSFAKHNECTIKWNICAHKLTQYNPEGTVSTMCFTHRSERVFT